MHVIVVRLHVVSLLLINAQVENRSYNKMKRKGGRREFNFGPTYWHCGRDEYPTGQLGKCRTLWGECEQEITKC